MPKKSLDGTRTHDHQFSKLTRCQLRHFTSKQVSMLYEVVMFQRSPRTRCTDAARLLSSVRLIYLSPEHISDHIEANPLFASTVCHKYVLLVTSAC